ncbi:MAG: hypothetical protein ACREQ9_06360 [Candidatus Binatia bacterium]
MSTLTGFDSGCSSAPQLLVVDPAITLGLVQISVPSSCPGGGTLTATVVASGTGTISPSFGFIPDAGGTYALVAAGAGMTRSAVTQSGSVSSPCAGDADVVSGGGGSHGYGITGVVYGSQP